MLWHIQRHPLHKNLSRYRQELLDLQASQDIAAAKRATYELSLMENSCFIELNGIVHHYHDSGPKDAAQTVLLIHGWDCWWMWWHYVINYLNKQRNTNHCIRYARARMV